MSSLFRAKFAKLLYTIANTETAEKSATYPHSLSFIFTLCYFLWLETTAIKFNNKNITLDISYDINRIYVPFFFISIFQHRYNFVKNYSFLI
jgi:hypothetical protein